ncbi:hypothetical protein WJX73_002020 [Symbiochloris irregularis]|uniref:Trichome birefringence-like C-terminal domain-containing protein n=1 Tax=Symbiochloris irregularis TaxID=706552 RepID=A0AAW1P4J7_9CHLO
MARKTSRSCGLVLALLLVSVTTCASLTAACPKYMGIGNCGAQVQRCNLRTADYHEGTWTRRPADCEIANHAGLTKIAYNFTGTCYGDEFDCRPEAYSCFKRSIQVANWMESKYVVFNTGHHWWHLDPDFKQYEAMIRKVFEYMRDNFPTQHIFFRTSNMGHMAPEQFVQPLIGPYMPKRPNEWYRRWVQIQQEETLWATLAPQYQLENRFLVLNISFTDARADAHTNFRVTLSGDKHPDWLHYCTPGVPDWWNWLVYNALEQTVGT